MHAFDRQRDGQTDRYRPQELAFNIVECALKIHNYNNTYRNSTYSASCNLMVVLRAYVMMSPKNCPKIAVFWHHVLGGKSQISDVHIQIRLTSEHVPKFSLVTSA